jgi:hypothetical protein
MAVYCGIRDARKQKTSDTVIPRNKKLREFYDKKRDEGKPYKVAMIACVNKLLPLIYTLLKNTNHFPRISLKSIFNNIKQNLPKMKIRKVIWHTHF